MTASRSLPPSWPRARLIRYGVNLLLLLLFVALLGPILSNPVWQADARLRHHIVRTWHAGLNPYDPTDVSSVAGERFDTAFIYPPDTLPIWQVFSIFGPGGVRPMYLGFQLLLLGALVVCWQRFFLDPGDGSHPMFLLLCLAGLSNTLLDELRAGNISLLEQALLWSGLAAWLRGRYVVFAVLLWLAAACKLTPLAFSVLLLLPPVRRWGLFALIWLTMGARLALDRMLSPTLFHDFTRALAGGFGGAHDGGRNNPSLLELIRDVWQQIDDTLDAQEMLQAVVPVYAVIVLIVLGGSWIAWRAICRRFASDDTTSATARDRGIRLIFLVALAYTLTVPRMKDYSYILLLPVVWQTGKWFLARQPQAWLGFVVLLCMSNFSESAPFMTAYTFLWRYVAYFGALAAWVFLLYETFLPPRAPVAALPGAAS